MYPFPIKAQQFSVRNRNKKNIFKKESKFYLRRSSNTKSQFSVDRSSDEPTEMFLILFLLTCSTFVVGQNKFDTEARQHKLDTEVGQHKFDIDVDSAVKWSTDVLRSKGNLFPAGPTLSARHTSLNALVTFESKKNYLFVVWALSVPSRTF